jgi:hypothetical protein
MLDSMMPDDVTGKPGEPVPVDDPIEEIRGEWGLTEQAEKLQANASELIKLLSDHQYEAEERAEYIDGCDWPDKIGTVLSKQTEVHQLLKELEEEYDDYYH